MGAADLKATFQMAVEIYNGDQQLDSVLKQIASYYDEKATLRTLNGRPLAGRTQIVEDLKIRRQTKFTPDLATLSFSFSTHDRKQFGTVSGSANFTDQDSDLETGGIDINPIQFHFTWQLKTIPAGSQFPAELINPDGTGWLLQSGISTN